MFETLKRLRFRFHVIFTYQNTLFNSGMVAFACPCILEAEAEEPSHHWETSQSEKKAGRETDDKQKWEGIDFMFLTFFSN